MKIVNFMHHENDLRLLSCTIIISGRGFLQFVNRELICENFQHPLKFCSSKIKSYTVAVLLVEYMISMGCIHLCCRWWCML